MVLRNLVARPLAIFAVIEVPEVICLVASENLPVIHSVLLHYLLYPCCFRSFLVAPILSPEHLRSSKEMLKTSLFRQQRSAIWIRT